MTVENAYMDFAMEQIVNLCKIPSPSGFTKHAVEYLVEEFGKMEYHPVLTKKSSVLVDMGGEGEPLVLAAHIDTLGAMVRTIKDNGRLRITKIGGYPENNIEMENCSIHTRSGKIYSGTIQLTRASTHVYEDVGDIKRTDSTLEVVVDEKVKSKTEVQSLGIRTGDFISFDPRIVVTDSGFIKSRHLDDKASAGVLVSLARFVKEKNIRLSRKVTLLFTTYEEVGHGGSSGIPQDTVEMISVDMGAIGDDLETNEYKVSICAKDSQGPYDYDVTTRLIHIAEKLELNYAVDIYPRYGSDVDSALRSGYDIRHGLIGPGVYASHGYERTHREGIESTFKLILAYIQD